MRNGTSVYGFVKNQRQPGEIVTVSGGKGGTGKTNVAVNLAVALSQHQRQVVLMDADIGLANAEVVMGLRSKETLQSVIEGRKVVAQVLTAGPNGIKVVPGVSGLNHLADLDKNGQRNVRVAMEDLQARFDFVIIDTMAGIGPPSVGFAAAADHVLLVTTPEPSSLLDGYAMVKMIHGLNSRSNVHVLVNMADDRQQASNAMNKLAAAATRFLAMHLDYAGHILRDLNVRKAALMSYPFLLMNPSCPASMGIKELASTFLNESADEQNCESGFFRRFAQSLGIA